MFQNERVFLLQGGLSFLIWIGYGVFQSRRAGVIRERVQAMSRVHRGVLGAALFLVGAMVLIGGLAITLQSGGFTRSGLTPVGWVAITALGFGFVHAQTMGMAMLVSLIQENVTNDAASASIKRTAGDKIQP